VWFWIFLLIAAFKLYMWLSDRRYEARNPRTSPLTFTEAAVMNAFHAEERQREEEARRNWRWFS
jgi:hypothetical protein